MQELKLAHPFFPWAKEQGGASSKRHGMMNSEHLPGARCLANGQEVRGMLVQWGDHGLQGLQHMNSDGGYAP